MPRTGSRVDTGKGMLPRTGIQVSALPPLILLAQIALWLPCFIYAE